MEITDELQQEIELLIQDNQKLRSEHAAAMRHIEAQQGLLDAYRRLFLAFAGVLAGRQETLPPQVQAALTQLERDVHQPADEGKVH